MEQSRKHPLSNWGVSIGLISGVCALCFGVIIHSVVYPSDAHLQSSNVEASWWTLRLLMLTLIGGVVANDRIKQYLEVRK